MAGSRNRPTDFFTMIPQRSVVIFLSAVFFIFAPLSILLVSSFEQDRPPGAFLFLMFISGALAVSWAATFTISRKFVVGIVVFTVGMSLFSGPFRQTAVGMQQGVLSWEGVGSVLIIVVGYTLFIVFISGQGRTTMRLMTEMALAQDIHDTLVPAIEFESERLKAHGVSLASSEMGGDLIDLVDHQDATDLFLVDVAGHGVKAGVVMGMIKSALRMGLGRRGSLGELTGEINDVLDRTTSPELYATLAGLRIDPAARRVECVLAGHHHLLHYRAATREMDHIAIRNFPVGMMAQQTFTTRTIDAGPGDLFVLYTDGLNETENAAGEELGHDAIEQTITGLSDRPLEEIRRAVFDLVESHGPQVDDRTLLLSRLH